MDSLETRLEILKIIQMNGYETLFGFVSTLSARL